MMTNSVSGTWRSNLARLCRHRALIALLVAGLQLALSASVAAQGTMGVLPDPITSRELDDYARRLGLSAQQRVALESFHQDYKTQFAALREGDIEKYLSGNPVAGGDQRGGRGQGGRGGMGGRGMGMGLILGNTDRKDVEQSLRDLKSINERIRSLDNLLFDQIQTLLTEEQTQSLNSVRLDRERDRYSTGLGRMASFTNPSTHVDLTDLVSGMTLSPQEDEAVTPLLMAYEASLTSAVKKLHDDANDSTIQMMDEMAKRGFTAQTLQDRERRGEMFEAFRTVWGEIMSNLSQRGATIADLNRRTEKSLHASLGVENGRRLRDSFYRRAYPEIRGSSNTSRAFEMVLELEDLSEEQRTAVTALYDQYRIQLDRVYEQMADAVDSQRSSGRGVDFGGRGGRGGNNDSDNEEMNRLREQRQQLMDSMRTQLDASLTPEQLDRFQQRVAESRERGRGGDERRERGERAATFIAVAPGGAGGAEGQVITARIENLDVEGIEFAAARDPFVPGPMTDRDIAGFADRLSLDEEARAILNGLHTEYMDRYAQLDSTQIQAVREAEESLWQRSDGGRPTPPEPEAVDRLYSLRRQAIASVMSLDEQFFNDLQMVVLSDEQAPKLQRVRNTRLRAIYSRGGGQSFNIGRGGRGGGGGGPQRIMFNGLGGSGESNVDLSSIVEQAEMNPDVATSLEPALESYETAATAAMQLMFESSMRLRQTTDRMAGRFMRGDRGEQTVVTLNADDIRQAMENDGRAAREAATAMANLNRQTLDQMLANLDPSSAAELKSAYNRRAFPDIYRDWRSAETRLEAALELPDLNQQQLEAVQAMTIEFRNAYEALSEEMVALEREAPAMGGGPPDAEAIQALQERMRNRERLEFERNDLSDKMLTRLRAMLSEAQIQQLGLNRGERRAF